jgi:3-oxoacyl-[acyl-carrier-protein] synthase-1
MIPLLLSTFTVVNALGRGNAATFNALRGRQSGLRPCRLPFADLDTHVGEVAGLDEVSLPPHLAHYDCRNNRLAYLGLQHDGFLEAVAAARDRYGAGRIAVILGTSTSGILQTETAYRQCDPVTGALPEWFDYRCTHNIFSSGDFVRHVLQLTGPAYVISTACSSSAKVFSSAHRLITLGLCDAAVVGGVDSLCATTLYGFSSLELVARGPCRPADAHRDGISIGEAAGFALLERAEPNYTGKGVALLGYGESSDAYHMSSPHPEGAGALLAMQRALTGAGLDPGDIDYINLHGTASKANDAVENRAVSHLFGNDTPCGSTKGWTGHTLGAAGITEAVIACLCIERGLIPGSINTSEVDPAFMSRVVLENNEQRVARVLSNSFGFGGNNCGLIFGAPP